jgi:hypothetical protein
MTSRAPDRNWSLQFSSEINAALLFIREVPAGAMKPHDAVLTAFDKHMRATLEIGVGQESLSPVHYVHHTGVEYVKDGLRLLSAGGERHGATNKELERTRTGIVDSERGLRWSQAFKKKVSGLNGTAAVFQNDSAQR